MKVEYHRVTKRTSDGRVIEEDSWSEVLEEDNAIEPLNWDDSSTLFKFIASVGMLVFIVMSVLLLQISEYQKTLAESSEHYVKVSDKANPKTSAEQAETAKQNEKIKNNIEEAKKVLADTNTLLIAALPIVFTFLFDNIYQLLSYSFNIEKSKKEMELYFIKAFSGVCSFLLICMLIYKTLADNGIGSILMGDIGQSIMITGAIIGVFYIVYGWRLFKKGTE